MKLKDLAKSKKPIILVFGRLCSGKGTYCEQFIKKGYFYISISDVVRKLTGAKTRAELQSTRDFDRAIAENLIKKIGEHDNIIIDGIRQTSIIDRIVDEFGEDKIQMIWLDVPTHKREARYIRRRDPKDTQTFSDAEAGDVALGIGEVESKYKPRSRVVRYY